MLSLSFPLIAIAASECAFYAPANPGCHAWSALDMLPAADNEVHSSWPDTYWIAAPCRSLQNATIHAACPNTPLEQLQTAFMVQVRPGGECLALGNTASAPTVTANADPTTGLTLEFGGGFEGRAAVFDLRCNMSTAEPSAPAPLLVESPSEHYRVVWQTKFACPASTQAPCPAPPTPPPAPLPLPSTPQLEYAFDEIGAIGHFNMGTFQSCNIGATAPRDAATSHGARAGQLGGRPFVPPPATFAPADIDTDGWLQSLKAYGARRAVLVVSHGCGFSTFASRTAFPQFDFVYNYSITHAHFANGTAIPDVAERFVASCHKYGIKPGFYYGAMNNAFLNVVGGKVQSGRSCDWCPDITQDQYTQVLLAQLRQLWSSYGKISEVWFDGGFPEGTKDKITALQQELQPDAVGFQGPSPNSVRWAGTESGHCAQDMWMTSAASTSAGAGDPNAEHWFPPEADTCFQEGCHETGNGPNSGSGGERASAPYGGCWFYNEGMCAPPLSSLISKYHDTVGRSALLLLDWAPSPNGTVRADHANMYQQFGNWIRSCYGGAAAVSRPFNGTLGVLPVSVPTTIDRIVLGEDISQGQRVRAFTVEVDGGQVYESKSIGHKRIILLSQNMTVHNNVTVHISEAVAPPLMRVFEARLCFDGPSPSTSCNAILGSVFKGPLAGKASKADSASACCDACRAEPACAVYNFHKDATCELLSAQSGTIAEEGATSGTPSH